ncbi:MAG: peptidoglycan DD-metalloendopeptidase family protein [Caenibius sp.]
MIRGFIGWPLLVPLALLAGPGAAQSGPRPADPGSARTALQQALAAQREAEARGARLEAEATRANEAVEKTAREAAALAARIQQSEAAIAASEARLRIVARERAIQRQRLARMQRPLVRLTAALQKLSRRPMALSVLRPGSLQDLVYMRAVLAAAIPQVERRTASLRAEIAKNRQLAQRATALIDRRRADEAGLEVRRRQLAALETRQRLAQRQASGTAAREAERALALGEQARDLDTLIGQLDEIGNLRQRLAALPGPIMRPPRPAESEVMNSPSTPAVAGADRPPGAYQLPVAGRTIAGFGAIRGGGTQSAGITLAPRASAQIIAPAGGRVAFAGPYRGYGRIVIIEHGGGWTSLVTGLGRVDVQVGQQLVSGSPLGIAAARNPAVTLELRRAGEPVNPLEVMS